MPDLFEPDYGDDFRYIPRPSVELPLSDDPVDDPVDDLIGDPMEASFEAAWREGRITRDSPEARRWKELRNRRFDEAPPGE
ncbi:hypothetical protein [Kitasatospora sp. NPDC094015]|uniref:hypothetical protein n=1 Tax=Kitasatospora sp. NPDC094015 TaxID=3155205 RepID=UPI003333F5D7